MDGLGYKDPDVCDMLYALESEDWECLEESHWIPDVPVGTFITEFLSVGREEHGMQPDTLFVEVAIREADLYLLACKQDGSPE